MTCSRSLSFFLALATILTMLNSCAAPPPPLLQLPTVKILDPLGGTTGEHDDAALQVEATEGPVPPGTRLILRLPGVQYPDNYEAMIPIVRASLGATELPLGASDSQGECFSPSRSRYDQPILLPQGIPQGGRVLISINKYRLPLRATEALPISVAIAREKDDAATLLAAFVAPVVAGHAVAVLADLPSEAGAGEPLELRVTGVDRFGNPAVPLNRDFTLDADGRAIEPSSVSLDEQGRATVALRPLPAGVYRVTLTQNNLPWGKAGPCAITANPPARRHWWGDPHSHTGYSDAFTTAGASEAWSYARDTAHLDFAAVTDHAEPIWGCPLDSTTEWAAIRQAARAVNKPGAFTAFLGYEWTGSFPFAAKWPTRDGHAHVLFPADDGELCRADLPDCDSFAKLIDRMKAKGALTIRHHTIVVWGAAKAPIAPLATMPVIELFSSHGSSECLDCPRAIPEHVNKPGYSVQDYLLSGLRLGLIGGTDNHLAHPGSRAFAGQTALQMDAGGLTCVLAEKNTRSDLFAALHARACYATTGARILVDFGLGSTTMGQTAAPGATPDFRFAVHAVDPLAKLEILRGDLDAKQIAVVFTLESTDLDVAGQWLDPRPARHAFYYLRVTQGDGQMAWSSPIWLDR